MNIIKMEAGFCEKRENMMDKVIGGDLKMFIKMEDQTHSISPQLTENSVLACKEDGKKSAVIKMEAICDASENGYEKVDENCIRLQDRKINNVRQLATNGILTFKDDLSLVKIKEELTVEMNCKVELDDNLIGTEVKPSLLSDIEEIEIKTEHADFDSFQDGDLLPQSADGTKLRKVQKCPEPSPESNLSNYQWGNVCETGVETHKPIPSAVKIYRCELCPFETKHKQNLKIHMITHKCPSELAMYQCPTCLFQTKYKSSLKNHLRTHKSLQDGDLLPQSADGTKLRKVQECPEPSPWSNLSKYQCGNVCETDVKTHQPIPSEVKVYQCESCPFETKHKQNLKIHMITHKCPSELAMYQCPTCLFHTKYKSSLKNHLLTHKSSSELIMCQCEMCPFQTKHKNDLKKHMIVHTDPSEGRIYVCESCPFQTKRKGSLKNHMVVHADPSEVQIYQCESCTFQTRRKGALKRHVLVHKNRSEGAIYRCESCPFQTRRISGLREHMLLHRDPSAVRKYQ